jgi:hypothetical protein
MTDREPIGEILRRALQDIDDAGGPERHQLRELIGQKTYDAMMAKQRTADLIARWLDAGPKPKGAATRALAVGIARQSDRPELIARIEREIGDAFDLPVPKKANRPLKVERAPTVKKHAEAVRQAKNDQRPMRTDLAALAKGDDASRYIKARRSAD